MGALAKKQALPDDFDVTDSACYGLSNLSRFAPYEEWYQEGKCVPFFTSDPDFFFSHTTELTATVICNTSCKVRVQCLSYALINDIQYGVWGGMTEKERKSVSRMDINNLINQYKAANAQAELTYPKLPVLRVVR